MARTMALPKIGVNLEEITIVRWLVKPGDRINEGDLILEAETDKATQEFFATESGVVAALLAGEGDVVPVGADIVAFVDEGEEYAVSAAPLRLRVSPIARKAAKELGIDAAKVPPVVPGGRITIAAVRSYAGKAEAAAEPAAGPAQVSAALPATQPATKPAAGPAPGGKLTGIRKTIAARLSQSASEKPTVPLTLTADASALLSLRECYKQRGMALGVDAVFVRIVAAALKLHPRLNAAMHGDELVMNSHINVGVATDTPDGLLVPVVKGADSKTLQQLGAEVAGLSQKAIEGSAGQEDLAGGTFTITNLGAFGIEEFAPIINPPECAILAIGAIKPQFCPDDDGNPVLKKLIKLTLVFDHRIVDGAPAAKFLGDVKQFLERPELML